MTELLSMPIPFALSLVVLGLVAAYFFFKFVALAFTSTQGTNEHHVDYGQSVQASRRSGQQLRRATDHVSGGNIVLS